MSNTIEVSRHDRIVFLESKLVGAKVAYLRAKDMFLKLNQLGLIFVAEFYRAEFVSHEHTIHAYSTELDKVRGWTV